MSMDLTEPDAGSDLQSVMLKATYDEANNCWRLNGVKRFITVTPISTSYWHVQKRVPKTDVACPCSSTIRMKAV